MRIVANRVGLAIMQLLAVGAFCFTSCAFVEAQDFSDFRSIFVDRFDYPYNTGNIPGMTTQINNMMQAAANEGFTDVIWQVRGRGDALYDSNYEPKTSGLTAGFDPLQVALDAAHSRGLKLHAWINTTTLWNTTALNPPAGHIYHNAGPSFRLRDINGNLEPQNGWSNYSSVNPVLPEVHTHINNVVQDIATNYNVDGINLDYIRYIPGANNAAADFAQLPHDPISHQMFSDATGLDAANIANFGAYKAYITGRITDLVASIKNTVDAAEISTDRTILLSADVWRDPDIGKNDYMQDYRTWLQQDLLDIAMPMIYLSASNDHLFNPNLLNTLGITTNARVVPTLASYLHVNSGGGGVALTLSQIDRANDFGADGVGFYDFPAFFNSYSAADRAAIKNYFDSLEPPPPPGPGNVIDNFEVDEGHFGSDYDHSPISQTFGLADGANGTTIDRVTTEAQTGQGSQELNLVSDGSANWQLRHNSGIGPIASPAGNVPLEATGYVGFWLKTDDPDVTVRLALDDPVGNTAIERSLIRDVIADDEWHLYQWNLEDDSQWTAFAGGANGIIDAVGGTVTIDSIWFAGSDDSLIYMDNVSHNPDGMLVAAPVPGDYNGDGVVDAEDYSKWRTSLGQTVTAGTEADGNGDGVVNAADFVFWRDRQGAGGSGSSLASQAAVPEPASWALWALAVLGAIAARRR